MPSKSSKAASKQAKLNQKKRRGKGAPSVVTASIRPSESGVDTDVIHRSPASTAIEKQRKAVSGDSSNLKRTRLNTSGDVAVRPSYLNVELRQIAIITGLIVASLIALTFVLG